MKLHLTESLHDDPAPQQIPELVSEPSMDGTNAEPSAVTGKESSSNEGSLDQLSDQAFPLFLRFKASDNISSVADAIREKSHKSMPKPTADEYSGDHINQANGISSDVNAFPDVPPVVSSEEAGVNEITPHSYEETYGNTFDITPHQDFTPEDLSDFDIDQEALSRPIFKPAPVPVEEPVVEAEALNIPDVFQQHVESDNNISTPPENTVPDSPVTVERIDYPDYLDNTEVPVFVPLSQISQSQTAPADTASVTKEAAPDTIPVFAPPKADRSTTAAASLEPAKERPGSHEYHAHQEKSATRPGTQDASKSSSHKPVKSSVSAGTSVPKERNAYTSSPSTERLVNNRYTAAQQMGTIAPLPLREAKARRKSGTRMPIFIALLVVASIIGLIALWSFMDLGSVLFGRSTNSTTQENSSDPAAITTLSQSSAEESSSAATATVTTSEDATIPSSAETTQVSTSATTKATTEATTSATTEATTIATTEATTEATTVPTTQETSSKSPDKVPAWFDATISNGTSDQDTAIFDLNFKNMSPSTVSLYNGLKQITLTFVTDIEITTVTCDSFTFTPKEGKKNVFIGVPTSKEEIEKGKTLTTTINGKSSGASVGKYTVKFFLEYYE